MIGKTLGHFEIEASAGAGGMGEVYRARDSRLQRTVAIKVLPAELAADEQRRERLKREALAISRLNHPHVCTLYDIGHADGVDYLVLEYLEGKPLSDRLRSGGMPLGEALTIAAQVADGLDAAHRLGIVHRDLKPANVMLTSSDAKLLDFGLAKEAAGSTTHGTLTATRTVLGSAGDSITVEGTILGTLHYMSPEQLHGEPADARSDIFSFGAMLYEMVTGNAPFTGKSQASVIASILEKSPQPVSEHVELAPSALDRLVTRCLQKDPDSRWQSARDVMHELRWIASGAAEEHTSQPVPTNGASGLRAPLVAAISVVIALVGLAAGLFLGPRFSSSGSVADMEASQPMVRATIPLPEGLRIAGWGSPTVAISDDGSTVAFVTTDDNWRPRLYVRRLDATESILVPDSVTAEGPIFSPDGKWLLFAVAVSGGARNIPSELRMYSLESGITQTLCPVRDYFGADWHESGEIVWSGQLPKGLWRIAASGGAKENFLQTFLVDDEQVPLALGWPSFLPDGRRMFVSGIGGGTFSRGGIVDLETGEFSDLGVESCGMQMLPDGRVAWVDLKGTLMVAPFDMAGGQLAGTGRAVDREISLGGGSRAVLAVAKNGTAVLTRGPILGSGRSPRQLVRIGDDGVRMTPAIEPGLYRSFSLSPDGSRVVLGALDGLRIHDVNRGGRTDLPLGTVELQPFNVAWSPDGKWVAFRGTREGLTGLSVFVVAADGNSQPRLVFEAESEASPLSWEPDSRGLLVGDFATDGSARVRVYRVPVEGGSPTEVELGGLRGTVRISPQGDLIAYIQPQGGSYSVFVRSYPELGPKVAVASGEYWAALWSKDGSTIYGFDADGVDAFEISSEPRLEVNGRQRIMDDLPDVHRPAVNPGTLGGFFVLEDVPGSGVITSIEVVTNWAQNLP